MFTVSRFSKDVRLLPDSDSDYTVTTTDTERDRISRRAQVRPITDHVRPFVFDRGMRPGVTQGLTRKFADSA